MNYYDVRLKITQAGSGDNNSGSFGPSSLPCDSLDGAEAVAAPPVSDDLPGSAGADEILLDEVIEFDLKPLPDDDSDPQAFPRSRRLICSTSTDGQTTFYRYGERGLVLTAEETMQAYEFLANTATVWRRAL